MARLFVPLPGVDNHDDSPLVAWHPARPTLAVVHGSAAAAKMQCYSLASQSWTGPEMSNDLMRGARCVGWAPLGEIVAVGCEHGVCVWHLHLPDSWMSFLQHAGPVRALSWSPTGRHLATASAPASRGDALQVWDVTLRAPHALHAPGGAPTGVLAWAPTGSHLFAAFADTLSVWETSRWGCEHFDFPGVCTAAAWAPDGQRLALAVAHLATGDLVWVSGAPGEAWAPATVHSTAASGRAPGDWVNVARHSTSAAGEEPDGEPEHVPRSSVHGDRPLLVGRLLQRTADTAEFGLSFESSFLPAFEAELADACDGAPQLPSSAVTGLAWAPDGAQLLASFQARSGGYLHTAVGTYVVNAEPLSLSPGALLDLRASADEGPPRGPSAAAFWPKGAYRGRGFVAAAGLPRGGDLLARGAECGAGLTLYQ